MIQLKHRLRDTDISSCQSNYSRIRKDRSAEDHRSRRKSKYCSRMPDYGAFTYIASQIQRGQKIEQVMNFLIDIQKVATKRHFSKKTSSLTSTLFALPYDPHHPAWNQLGKRASYISWRASINTAVGPSRLSRQASAPPRLKAPARKPPLRPQRHVKRRQPPLCGQSLVGHHRPEPARRVLVVRHGHRRQGHLRPLHPPLARLRLRHLRRCKWSEQRPQENARRRRRRPRGSRRLRLIPRRRRRRELGS